MLLLLACGPRAGPADTGDNASPGPALQVATVVPGAVTVPEATPARWRFTPVACPAPEDRAEARFDRVELGERPVSERHLHGGGLAGADLDADGRLDVVLATEAGLDWLEWDGHTLAPRPSAAPGVDLSLAVGVVAADGDGDGDLDLFVTRWRRPDVLLRNDGGRFVDGTAAAGLPREALRSTSAAFGDADGDGDLDLAVATFGPAPWEEETAAEPSRLFLNDGAGGFVDASPLLSPWGDGWTFLLAWQDLDADGRPELLVLNDNHSAQPTTALAWSGGRLVPFDAEGFFPNTDSMGQGVGDLNGDARPDFVHSTFKAPALRQSLAGPPRPTWIDAGPALGLEADLARGQVFGWGVELADLDHDGDLDLPVVYGAWDRYPLDHWDPVPADQHDALFRRDGDGFTDVAEDWGLDDAAAGRGLLVVDVDGDGWLDLVKRQLDGPDLLYRQRCCDAAWLSVRLHTDGPNRDAVGARVEVVADGRRHTRWVGAGSTSLFTGSPPQVWVGLGSADAATVVVHWPDGTVSPSAVLPTRGVVDVRRAISPARTAR